MLGGGHAAPPSSSSQDEAKKTLSCQFVRPSVRPAWPRRSLRAPVTTVTCPGTSCGPGGVLVRAPRAGRSPWPPCFPHLVHPFPAVPGSAVAGDLVLVVLEVELVVVGELGGEQGVTHGTKTPSRHRDPPFPPRAPSDLLPLGDAPAGDDDDFVLLVEGHDFSHAVRGARVVDVPGGGCRAGGGG